MPAPSFRRVASALALGLVGCSRSAPSGSDRLPGAEFLLTSPDSTFWVTTTGGATRMRGVPLILASYDSGFHEVYVADDDFSYDDALLVGEHLYRRDLATGDSAIMFADTTVARIAAAYARAHPDAQPLGPDDDGEANPSTSATAEVDILDVYGPYLSYEYHVDVDLPGQRPWHSTRRGVVDLRTGKAAALSDLFGAAAGAKLAGDARQSYQAIRDSVVHARAAARQDERRAIDALEHLQFDDRSFTVSEYDGKPEVTFGVPGRGDGPEGNVVELEPMEVAPPAWWIPLASSFPRLDDEGADRWTGAGYDIVARYDTSGETARLTIADSSKREWPLASVRAPLLQVFWLDHPPMTDAQRRALGRAFNQAAKYDENARIARHSPQPDSRYALVQVGPRKSARDVRAHDARACQQHGPCIRRRDIVDDGQDRGDRRLSSQPRQRRDGIDRSRRLSRADSPRRPRDHEGERQLRGANFDGGRSACRSGRALDGPPPAHQLVLPDLRCR